MTTEQRLLGRLQQSQFSFVLFVRAHEAAPNLAPHWTGRLPILFWNSVGGGAGAAAEQWGRLRQQGDRDEKIVAVLRC